MHRKMTKPNRHLVAAIQPLEPRRLFADAFASLSGTTLNVNGTDGDDVIVVTPNDTTGELDATLNGQTLSFDPTKVEVIHVSGGDGNDQISVLSRRDSMIDGDAGDDNILTSGGTDTLDGEGGNDTMESGSGGDRIFADEGNDSVFARQGSDTINSDEGADII